MEYSYPISMDWSVEEIISVINFFEIIEKVYKQGVNRKEMMAHYRKFKKVVPSIAEEKKIFREFQEMSGYSAYHAVKMMKESKDTDMIRL